MNERLRDVGSWPHSRLAEKGRRCHRKERSWQWSGWGTSGCRLPSSSARSSAPSASIFPAGRSTRLAGSRLSQAPEGLNRGIGREIDLLFALREWRHLELTLLLARFRPGAAFAANRRDPANMIEIGATPTF